MQQRFEPRAEKNKRRHEGKRSSNGSSDHQLSSRVSATGLRSKQGQENSLANHRGEKDDEALAAESRGFGGLGHVCSDAREAVHFSHSVFAMCVGSTLVRVNA
jgi:hypothetical protein